MGGGDLNNQGSVSCVVEENSQFIDCPRSMKVAARMVIIKRIFGGSANRRSQSNRRDKL